MTYSREIIAEKQGPLDTAREVFKSEFVGIDTVIDNVIDTIRTWFLFSELQEPPLIVNLWGITGVCKTALVRRLAALVGYEQQLFRFDLGNKAGEKTGLTVIAAESLIYLNRTINNPEQY